MSDQSEIELKAFTIEQKTWKVSRIDHQVSVEHDFLDSEYDAHLSDMDGETFIVEPDGTLLWPYVSGPSPDNAVMQLVTPVLDCVPLQEIKDYLIHREQRLAEEIEL